MYREALCIVMVELDTIIVSLDKNRTIVCITPAVIIFPSCYVLLRVSCFASYNINKAIELSVFLYSGDAGVLRVRLKIPF